MIVKSDAIILNSRRQGDTSKIISAFTLDYGRISLIAKGALMPKSKFGASLEPLSYSNITFYYKSNSDLHLLSNSEIIKSYNKITQSADNLTVAMMIAESINYTQEINHPNPELFEITRNILNYICLICDNPYNYFIKFMLELAENLGFAILSDEKIVSEINDINISLSSGSVIIDFITNNKNYFKFNINEFKYLNDIINYSLDDIALINTDKRCFNHIYNFFVHYFSFHLEKKFNLRSAALI
jgi:DNA repair protein RecO (recombination protein O)